MIQPPINADERRSKASHSSALICVYRRPIHLFQQPGIDQTFRLRREMNLLRIREAKPLDNHRVQLTLTDGRVVERDLEPLLRGPILRNSASTWRDFVKCAWKVERLFGLMEQTFARTR
jgi:hypothetical protein